MPNRRGGPIRPSAPGIPGTVWHTAQPALVKISVIGSSPVTSGTMSGPSATTDETGAGLTEEELMERRANNVPSNSTITMKGVINRSGMEQVVGKVRQSVSSLRDKLNGIRRLKLRVGYEEINGRLGVPNGASKQRHA